MKRLASAVLLMAALACGSGDSGPTAATPSPSPTQGSGASSGVATQTGSGDAGAPAAETTVHPSVPRCLDLVRAGQLVEAVTPCSEALKNAPDNQQVAAALDRAKQAASEQASAAAQAAANDAAAGAGGDAASALQDKTGSLPTQLP